MHTGSLFVAKRSDFPRFKIVVMNRNSKENLEVPLQSTFQMQVREPYLIFRLEKGEEGGGPQQIRGIWFHDGKERKAIVEVLERVVKSLSLEKSAAKQEGPPATTPSAPNSASQEHAPAAINRQEAAASLMAALKIGSDSGSTPQPQQPTTPQPQQPPAQEASVQNMVLDKKSLQLSLMSLLQDDRFLDLIHAQYLKVAKARAASETPKK